MMVMCPPFFAYQMEISIAVIMVPVSYLIEGIGQTWDRVDE